MRRRYYDDYEPTPTGVPLREVLNFIRDWDGWEEDRDQRRNEKHKKKEEGSKKGGKGLSGIDLFLIGWISGPIVGPLYYLLIQHMLHLMQ